MGMVFFYFKCGIAFYSKGTKREFDLTTIVPTSSLL